jgi:malonate transporter
MAVVVAALLPVFLLIVLGFFLKRSLMRLETQWHGLERLTYYVLFPALLIQTLVKADLTGVPVAGVGGALLLSVLVMSLLCLALRPLLARWDIGGPAFTSVFQGATRWQTYVALAVSGNLYGEIGLALASVAMVAIIPMVNVFSVAVLAQYASPEKQSVRAIAMTVVRNPLIWACAIGLAINVLHLPLPRIWHEVAEALGRSSLGIGLLVTGAGLHLEGMFRPSLPATVAVILKLILMPVLAVALALWFGLSGANLAIVTACSAVPASSSAYVLAREMGGDAPLLAQIITLQTILAALTMPIAIALVAGGAIAPLG